MAYSCNIVQKYSEQQETNQAKANGEKNALKFVDARKNRNSHIHYI